MLHIKLLGTCMDNFLLYKWLLIYLLNKENIRFLFGRLIDSGGKFEVYIAALMQACLIIRKIEIISTKQHSQSRIKS